MRPVRRAATLVVALVAGACSTEPTGVLPDRDAIDAAAEFTRLADSLSAADASLGAGYRALADVARGGGAIARVVISVDGVPVEYAAMVREIAREPMGACADPGALCLMTPPLRTMVAWQRGNPRRVVQLIGERGWLSGVGSDPGLGRVSNLPTLTFLDGAGGLFVGSEGAQSISEPVVSDDACWNESLPTVQRPVTCRRARFTVSFSGAVTSLHAAERPTGAIAHRLAMTPQAVAGARVLVGPPLGGPAVPPAYLPPISPRGPVLPATLSAVVAPGGVTFTLTVTNPSSAPAELHFGSGQQYDFRVRRAGGPVAWTWSADMSFVAALSSRTLAPGERVAYTARWTTTSPGSYEAEGMLTSTSHQATATAAFVVP